MLSLHIKTPKIKKKKKSLVYHVGQLTQQCCHEPSAGCTSQPSRHHHQRQRTEEEAIWKRQHERKQTSYNTLDLTFFLKKTNTFHKTKTSPYTKII